MTDADLDQLVRAADPAARLTAPPPGPLPDRTFSVPPHRPRRWLPAAAAAAAVVAVVALAVTTLGGSGSGNRTAGPGPAGGKVLPAPSLGPTGAAPDGGGSKAPQREHTASAGTEHQRAERLLGTLQRAVPASFTLPRPTDGHAADTEQPAIGPDGTTMPATDYQAVRDEAPLDYTGYEYHAWTIVSDGPRIGTVGARVWLGLAAGDLCAISSKVISSATGTCRLVSTAAREQVAITDLNDPGRADDPRETQSAVYRHPDGTVVLVSQGPGVLNPATPRLAHQVWTVAQLAEVATGAAFAR
jgi:hypothetical protein